MSKMKTHKGMAKRFKRTASGRLKRGSAFRSHLTGKKSSKRKRSARQPRMVSHGDQKRINELIP